MAHLPPMPIGTALPLADSTPPVRGASMNRRHATAVVLTVTTAALMVPAASAAPVGMPVAATVHTTFDDVPDEFTSTVPGCETGTVTDARPAAHYTPWGGVFTGIKVFECADGESGFAVRLVARFGEAGSTGTWTLSDAWGAYAGAKGSGTLVGVPFDGGIHDHYQGTVR
jgi:hypothetical protein